MSDQEQTPRVLSPKQRRAMEEAYLLCRTFGHLWDEFMPHGMRKASFGYRISLRCVRCTTERHDLIDVRGEVGQREYRYPDDYSLPSGVKRPELRVELVRRRKRRKR